MGGVSVSFLFGSRSEARAITSLPFNRSDGATLQGASLQAALRLVPLYAATGMITDSISTMPLHGYQRTAEGRKILAAKQPGLVTSPGVFGLGRVAWLSQCMMSLLLRGNAYGLIVAVDNFGTPIKIKWLHPDQVRVDESAARPRYFVGGDEITDLIVHIPAIVMAGSVVGLAPVTLFRKQVETGLRAGDLAHRWYADGISPTGILKNVEKTLKPEESAYAKERLKAALSERDVMVIGKDWGYEPLTATPADAQFIEAIEATANQFAAVYHVPPEDIGGKASSSMTYSTLEMNMIRYGQRAILPWTSRIENAIDAVLPPMEYVKFNLDALARTDLKTRMESHAIALDNGIETLAEARALEDRAPLTPEEIAAWQEYFVVPRPNGAGDTSSTRKLAAAEVAQKIYLAAGGQVLTPDEGRQLLVAAGFPLDIPGPDFSKGTP